MVYSIYSICAVLLIVFSVEAAKDLPSYFPRCYRNDPKLNECLLKATETVKPFLIKGVPELNVPSIEPLIIPEIELQQGTQALNFKASLKNVTVHGLSSYKLDKFDFDVPNLQFFCGGWVEKLDLEGKYKVSGKILIAPIEGEGTFTATVGKSRMDVYQKVKEVTKKGLVYISPVHTNSSISVGNPKAHLDGLFQNNEQLNKATNDVISDNIDILFEEIKPVLEKVITNFMEDILLSALEGQVPFDKLYPIKKDSTFLKICHRSDPNLGECIIESVHRLKPLLAHGIPEFGIPSCEPLYIPEVVLDQGSGAVSVNSSYKDIKVYGPSEFTLKQVKINLDRDRIRLKLHVPSLYLESKYTMEGRILMMPILGSGNFYGNYSDIEAIVNILGQKIVKDGEIYFNIKDFYIDFNIGHATIQLDNLFNGDEELGEAMNLFLNDNWKNVANEIKPVLEDTIASIFKKFSNKIYHKYPLSVLLPK
ncbi:uncharacterized protein LOC123310806 [Coccinella septempunctata]|uniref:uncharacterized protein LOC123310806 n=1 Tax=Coccinella septempunctata TaxID=41139 RepID=UPI001D063A90|nr:uncharacterized protein LOC123310806 [Coccinella septempunctata]